MTRKFKPLSYTAAEGGRWLPWPDSVDFSIKVLDQKKARGGVVVGVTADGQPLNAHSLRFGDPEKHTIPDSRWDCANGWTS